MTCRKGKRKCTKIYMLATWQANDLGRLLMCPNELRFLLIRILFRRCFGYAFGGTWHKKFHIPNSYLKILLREQHCRNFPIGQISYKFKFSPLTLFQQTCPSPNFKNRFRNSNLPNSSKFAPKFNTIAPNCPISSIFNFLFLLPIFKIAQGRRRTAWCATRS